MTLSSRSRKAPPFSEATIDKVIKCLGVKPSKRYGDSQTQTYKSEIRDRLNSIKRFFSDPDKFNQNVPPAVLLKLLKKQHRAVGEALKVFRSLEVGQLAAQQSKLYNASRKSLFEVSDVRSSLSGGLIGYDVMQFDGNFSTAIASLEKVEAYFLTALAKASSSVKGRGKNKPGDYSDHLLGYLCQLYRDATGEVPRASVDDIGGAVRGKIVKFLVIVLRKMPYPHKVTPWALEKRIRRLKTHENYRHLWEDAKR